MKRATLLLAVLLVAFAWLNLSPVATEAQSPYGPSVTSELKQIDVVVKTAATHTIVTGVTGKKIRIVNLFVRSLSTTANNIYFNEESDTDTFLGTNSTDVEPLDGVGISGKAGWVVNTGVWRTTETAGRGVQVTLSAAQPVAIVGSYVLCN